MARHPPHSLGDSRIKGASSLQGSPGAAGMLLDGGNHRVAGGRFRLGSPERRASN
jgi:hypothetical protein